MSDSQTAEQKAPSPEQIDAAIVVIGESLGLHNRFPTEAEMDYEGFDKDTFAGARFAAGLILLGFGAASKIENDVQIRVLLAGTMAMAGENDAKIRNTYTQLLVTTIGAKARALVGHEEL